MSKNLLLEIIYPNSQVFNKFFSIVINFNSIITQYVISSYSIPKIRCSVIFGNAGKNEVDVYT